MLSFEPAYIKTAESGDLRTRIDRAYEMLNACTLCPRKCRVDRLSGQTGICKTGKDALVSSYSPHFGEEAPLVGQNGSGTIFFTNCNLLCNFCQNYEISHGGKGYEADVKTLSEFMLDLQNMGCHNVNFVTPTHVVPQILGAVLEAVKEGLSIPIVYNSSAYDDIKTLELLDGIVDIYMPDFKFWNPEIA